ncbi:MAG TPA: two-component regulator propeller domain-containing protein [Bryobacteraceae bacterium]|jgi:ligand-binding sensor domain-containing protein|nr:two-component regulator propeller domain-containing protein [Bryobacteraceae bacterium]
MRPATFEAPDRYSPRQKYLFGARITLFVVVWSFVAADALALDPLKGLTQYTHKTWTQAAGLPQDAVGAIVQTTDGYLWLGTDEGLARFDGYEFTVFDKVRGDLPSNNVTALAAASDGSLWIGTTNGLTRYAAGRFRTYTTADGLSADQIGDLCFDQKGNLLIVAGGSVSRMADGRITTLAKSEDIPFSLRTVCVDQNNDIWIAGLSGLARWTGTKFALVIDAAGLNHNLINKIVADRHDTLWMAGSRGVVQYSTDGKVIRTFDTRAGLPDILARTVRVDRQGTLWVGTNSGFARLAGDRFTVLTDPEGLDRDLTRCIYEDREGDLWIGTNSGLTRLRDDVFTVYGKPEGFPGDDPNTVYQDKSGRTWIGFHNSGLLLFSPEKGSRVFTARDKLPSNEIFSIRETRKGTLLLATRAGLVRLEGMNFRTYRPPNELRREVVYDSLEDSAGRLWLAMSVGLGELRGGTLRMVIPTEGLLNPMVSLLEARDGALWVGTYRTGLWRLQGNQRRRFTTSDGLSSDQIRSLYEDAEGILWIATFDGGLNAFHDGKFVHLTTKQGLLSDNISNVEDDGKSLWLGTTRGICRIPKQQLHDFMTHKISAIKPVNYGVEDGLRSALCAPGYPVARGGSRTSDGKLWFPTSRGLAVIDPNAPRQAEPTPSVHVTEITVDGSPADTSKALLLKPGSERIRIRYAATYLRAPERVQYSHKLEGLDSDWVPAGKEREIYYNSLPRGKYRFLVRAEMPGGSFGESGLDFEKLPAFYETVGFRLCCLAAIAIGALGLYRLRIRQLRYRFVLILNERARLAREIHDTLAQGFIGISSQLEALATELPETLIPARRYLNIARRMARHSITEARRSIADLRASALEGHDLPAALKTAAQIWAVTSGIEIDVDAWMNGPLPEEYEQHLLRIAQEAVANTVKHARATRISIKLYLEGHSVCLRIEDNGDGFEQADTFSSAGGHFGLIGMRERAERLSGELRLASQRNHGTRIEVDVPLP